MKYSITRTEHLEIARDIGDAGVLLYMHYLRLCSGDHPDINDEQVAKSLGWTVRKTRDIRGKLSKHGWFRQVNYTRPDKVKGTDYHIGKEAVAALGPINQEESKG